MKTLIVGLGGVGGYIGARLAATYAGKPGHEIHFVARGAHKEHIQKRGLKLITGRHTEIVRPTTIGNRPQLEGTADLIILSTKAYDLAEAASLVRPVTSSNTITVSIQNGLGNTDILQEAMLNGAILDGVIYIISEILRPGEIRVADTQPKLVIGNPTVSDALHEKLEKYFKQADINVNATKKILKYKWMKFQFITAISVVTAAYNKTIGEVLSNKSATTDFIDLMEEIYQLAKNLNIGLPETSTVKSLEIAKASPPETTTSFQRDFHAGRKTELEFYLGYFLKICREQNIPVPVAGKYYKYLKSKAKI